MICLVTQCDVLDQNGAARLPGALNESGDMDAVGENTQEVREAARLPGSLDESGEKVAAGEKEPLDRQGSDLPEESLDEAASGADGSRVCQILLLRSECVQSFATFALSTAPDTCSRCSHYFTLQQTPLPRPPGSDLTPNATGVSPARPWSAARSDGAKSARSWVEEDPVSFAKSSISETLWVDDGTI